MSLTQTSIGVTGISAILIGILGAVLPDTPDFMIVHDVTYADGQITADRTVVKPGIADWRVTIVSAEGKSPTCNTIPGPKLHEGWSDYTISESTISTMALDIWVNDPGCLDRLEAKPGEYTQYVTWTPRDGREPVRFVGPVLIN